MRRKTAHRICEFCKKDFLAEQKEVNRGNAKYCSYSCVVRFNNSLKPSNPIAVFHKNITKNENGCWIYKRIEKNGYGSITVKRKSISAHRFSYELHYGIIPVGLYVCHKCDIKNCVNPDHLFIGTAKDNKQDHIKKGLAVFPRGTKQPHAQLNEEKVSKIKLKLKNGERQVDIAKEYGVKRNVIYDIKRGKNWHYVKMAQE